MLPDIHLALRPMLRRPARSIALAGVLGCGVAATTVAFSMLEGVLWRRLPYPESERLVWVGAVGPNGARSGMPMSLYERIIMRSAAALQSPPAAYERTGGTVRIDDVVDRLGIARVGGSMFDILRARPEAGRLILPDDDRHGAPLVAVISDSLSHSAFGGSGRAIGSWITIDDRPYQVVGVTPRGFTFPDDGVSVWTAIEPVDGTVMRVSDVPFLSGAVGRLRAPVDFREFRTGLQLGVKPADSPGGSRTTLTATSLHDHMVGDVRRGIVALALASALFLAIACAAVVSMQLASLTERRRELAIRAALGASVWRLGRQIASESLVLATIAGAIGLFLAFVGVRAGVAFGSHVIPEVARARIDWRVDLLATGVAACTALVAGAIPLGSLARLSHSAVLRESAATLSTGRVGSRVRDMLLGVSVAISLTLLISAVILAESLVRLVRTDLGFEAEGVVAAQITLPYTVITPVERQRIRSVATALLAQLEDIPRIGTVALTSGIPGEGSHQSSIAAPAIDVPASGRSIRVDIGQVSPSYFAILRIPIVRGRAFDHADEEGSELVAMVDKEVAQVLFPGEDPVGRILRLSGSLRARIFGVTQSVRQDGRIGDQAPQVYLSFVQRPLPYIGILTRGSLSVPEIQALLRATARQIAPTLPVTGVQNLDQIVQEELDRPAFYTFVVSALAGIAIALSLVSVNAAVASLVATRAREIGIRVALGASSRTVALRVIRSVTWITTGGILAGWALAFTAGRILGSLIHGVDPTNGVRFLLAAGLLWAIALLAAFVPAWRAAAKDPARVILE